MSPAAVLLALALQAHGAAFYKGTLQERRIYYEVDRALAARAVELELAVAEYRRILSGCVDFLPLGQPSDERKKAALKEVEARQASYVTFRKADFCSEDCIGNGRELGGKCDWTSPGEQLIRVSPDCDRKYLLHELGHKLGMIHEHNRPGRGRYVLFRPENLTAKPGPGYDLKYAFGEAVAADVDEHGLFDYGSIMIYGSCEFSAQPGGCKGKEVLVKPDGSAIPTPTAVSAQDAAALRARYCP